MATDERQLELDFRQHHLPPAAQEYIRQAFKGPSRLVGTNAATNVCASVPSLKNGHTIQAESITGELAFILECDFSEDTIELADQPPPIQVKRTYKNGVKRSGSYTADFVVQDHDGFYVVEVKQEKQIQKNLAENPADWQESDGEVIYVPAYEAFRQLGLKHVVKSTKELNPIRIANLRLLLEARRSPSMITEELLSQVFLILEQQAWITLADLAEKLKQPDFTPLLQLISTGKLVASINDTLLSQPNTLLISKTDELLALGQEAHKNNAIHKPLLRPNEAVHYSAAPSEELAKHVLDILNRIRAGEKSRSVRVWLKKMKEGKNEGLSDFQALLPQYQRCGNRKPRFYPLVEEYLIYYFENEHANCKRLPITKSHAFYCVKAKKVHPNHSPVSRITFTKRLQLLDPVKIARGRGGQRAANAARPPSAVEDRALKPTLPFELAQIDHYKLDLHCKLVSANGKHYTARPWMTVMVDVFTGAVLAIWISFRAPSASACAMVIRQCVRRHGRLPAGIIVDRGAEFLSVYFTAFMAHYDVTLFTRPSAHPRFGAEAERFFLAFKQQYLPLRPGNLAEYYESRSVSSSHAPSSNASLTLEQLWNEILLYIDWRNTSLVGNRAKSPAILLREGLEQYSCVGRKVTEDKEFILASAVDTKRYKIDPQRGIYTDCGFHYWHPALTSLARRKRPAEVRIEPEDPYCIYARVGNEWVTCTTNGAQQFATQDPVARLSEATRILDGSAARATAKQEADQALIQHIIDTDNHLSAQQVRRAKSESERPLSIPSQQSLFNEVRSVPLKPLKTTTWRKHQ